MLKRTIWLVILLALQFRNASVAAQEQAPAQWVVVTAPDFHAALKPLIEHRRAQGLKVVVIESIQVLTTNQIREGNGGALSDYLRDFYSRNPNPTYVLLAGAVLASDATNAERMVVPPLRGTIGRMKAEPTDFGYGRLSNDTPVAVGRFPARNIGELTAMVEKTMRLEQYPQPGMWRSQIVALIGNPGGASDLERQLAESIAQNAAAARFNRLHPTWQVRTIYHSTLSPFCLPDQRLRETALRYLEEGGLFTIYMGHSNAAGFWSQGAPFLAREDWAKLRILRGAGVFFSCGCFGCQLSGPFGEGYGLAAMRNPNGPAAVIGALGESYAALGQLALDGLLQPFIAPPSPARLGDYWLAVQAGLDHGPIHPATFYLYDQADGSRGKVPLAIQRQEHLEMWMLLGDPALRLPILPLNISLEVTGPSVPGQRLAIRGTLPKGMAGATLHASLERPLVSTSEGMERLPENPGEIRDQTMMRNHQRANQFILATAETQANEQGFECYLAIPTPAPWTNLVVRAYATKAGMEALGVATVPMKPEAR